METVADLESQYTDRPWDATVEKSLKWMPVSPASQPYATVIVGGKVVATIDNQGGVADDKLGERLRGLSEKATRESGPELAQDLAEQIAALLGGRVVKSDTAMTQRAFDALPPIEEPKGIVDYEALKQDPWYIALQSLKEKRAAYLNQQQSASAAQRVVPSAATLCFRRL